jgi:hypothetical protein
MGDRLQKARIAIQRAVAVGLGPMSRACSAMAINAEPHGLVPIVAE